MPSGRSWAIRSVAFSLATACGLESLGKHSVLNPHASTWVWNQVAQGSGSSFVKVCQDQGCPTKQYMLILFTHCMALSHVRQFNLLHCDSIWYMIHVMNHISPLCTNTHLRISYIDTWRRQQVRLWQSLCAAPFALRLPALWTWPADRFQTSSWFIEISCAWTNMNG